MRFRERNAGTGSSPIMKRSEGAAICAAAATPKTSSGNPEDINRACYTRDDGDPAEQALKPTTEGLVHYAFTPTPQCTRRNIPLFSKKHTFVFKKTYVCFSKNIPMIFQKHTYVFPETYL